MSNKTVSNCHGTLLDSDAGQNGQNYDHNEDFTFVICPPNGAQVSITFSSFCTEAFLDVLRIFDGPDTFSTLIGSYSGNINPGTIVANSGCMTLHFKSDANVACSGWIADWDVLLNPPTPPNILPISGVSCYDQQLQLTLDQPIPCDSVYPGAFSLSGPGTTNITGAIPNPCTGGTTTSILLSMGGSFGANGNYALTFTYHYLDACDSLHTFLINENFAINDCPIQAWITATSDTVCLGNCTQLEAQATGGNPPYSYAWSNGLPANMGPHMVCPVATTVYSVVVSDPGPSPSDTAYYTITVVNPPNAGPDQSVCENDPPVALAGIPAGGTWSGTGVNNNTFYPDSAGGGIHSIYYTLGGCTDSMNMTVIPISAGPDEAACPGTAPFMVGGFYPAGGTWSGANITAAGVFDPQISGSYIVTYTAPNGCTDNKSINVAPLNIQPDDTACLNLASYLITFAPYGGVWSGNGIINQANGEFNPNLAGTGVHTLNYVINGCQASIDITVLPINAGANFTACPAEGVINLPPASPVGGMWSGNGVTDPVNGLFDAGYNNGNNFTSTILYSANGCTDTVIAYVRNTVITQDTLWVCENEGNLPLDFNNTGRNPWDGNWSGAGVIDPNFPGTFSPSVAGPGTHTLNYTANTCVDSMVIVVYPVPVTQADTTVCETTTSFPLSGTPMGGLWSGPATSASGVFDPQAAGIGSFKIYYQLFGSCIDSMTVQVDPLPVVQINGLAPNYCYRDTLIPINALPAGGVLTGPGISGNNFNPKNAGPGTHWIKYIAGTGQCVVEDSVQVSVSSPISLQIPAPQVNICYGESVTISGSASGGIGGYTYQWPGIGFGQSQTVSPLTNKVYTLVVNDGCSEPASATIEVFVYPKITVSIDNGPKICHGDTGHIMVTAGVGKDYTYQWQTNPVINGPELTAIHGNYDLKITDNTTGCSIIESTTIDNWPLLYANFTPNPNIDCGTTLETDFDFVDFSIGGSSGTWDFGDGTTDIYSGGLNPMHTYSAAGTYDVVLQIANQGGCTDSHTETVCLEQSSSLFAPTAITPNGDGHNDIFKPAGLGVKDYKLVIFNRWGQKLFESNDIEQGWNGTFKGEPVISDAYTYLITYKEESSNTPQYLKGVVAVIR